MPTRLSAVVPAYNEAGNIRTLLDSLGRQKIADGELAEIVVVASGCTDDTAALVRAAARTDPRIRLIEQNARLGKVSAINAYLRERDPRANVLFICSADLMVQPGCLELMAGAFTADPTLGMCGARPVPTNPRGTLMGNVVGFLWTLHHERALEAPKLGEIVAVRAELLTPLDEASPVDEASLEAQVVAHGFHLGYVPEAVVVNRGPDKLGEYFEQRRRVAAGHFWLRGVTGYSVSTLDWRSAARLALRHFSITDPATDASHLVAIGIEALARGLGYLDYKRNYSHAVWKVASSARVVGPEAALLGAEQPPVVEVSCKDSSASSALGDSPATTPSAQPDTPSSSQSTSPSRSRTPVRRAAGPARSGRRRPKTSG